MECKEINELKAAQEALRGNVDMPMETRFKAWWELQHKINKLKD